MGQISGRYHFGVLTDDLAPVHSSAGLVSPFSEFDTVEGCGAALAAGRVTVVDLVKRGLERIERLDSGPGGLNAVITVSDEALAQARQSDQRRVRGVVLSPLDGIPFTVKDNIETVGLRTTHGSALFEQWIPESDAPVVQRLKAAGMVLLAKVSLDDFAGASTGESSLTGPMLNPHDRTRMVGGSSGGTAVSVAAGYAPLSLGTDTGGSLRIPAALCGVCTFRSTNGLVPDDGVFPRSPSQDVIGPMALTVAGLELSYAALVGADIPNTLPTPPAVAGLRLGVVETGLAVGGDDPYGPVLRRFREVMSGLSTAGVGIVPLAALEPELLGASIIAAEARKAITAYLSRPGMPVSSFEELLATSHVDGKSIMTAAVRRGLEWERVPALSADELTDLLRRRGALRDHTHRLMDTHQLDAIVFPTVQQVAAPLGQEQPGAHTRWSEHTGNPSVTIPMGLVDAGGAVPLPCALDLLGRHGQDARLLAVARTLELHVR